MTSVDGTIVAYDPAVGLRDLPKFVCPLLQHWRRQFEAAISEILLALGTPAAEIQTLHSILERVVNAYELAIVDRLETDDPFNTPLLHFDDEQDLAWVAREPDENIQLVQGVTLSFGQFLFWPLGVTNHIQHLHQAATTLIRVVNFYSVAPESTATDDQCASEFLAATCRRDDFVSRVFVLKDSIIRLATTAFGPLVTNLEATHPTIEQVAKRVLRGLADNIWPVAQRA